MTDLVLVNANVLTMDASRPRATAVAVAGGRITAVDEVPAKALRLAEEFWERRHKMHTAQMEKFAADEAAEAAAGGPAAGGANYSSESASADRGGNEAPQSTGGSLASAAQQVNQILANPNG